jgi:hypothetical protein
VGAWRTQGGISMKRGLLRLWIVIALIWVATTTWFLWNGLTAAERAFLVTTFNGHKYKIAGPEGATEGQAILEASRIAKSKELSAALLVEAYKRGLLSPEKKAAYEEMRRRGMIVLDDPGGIGLENQPMSKLARFRGEHPEFDHLSDQELADTLYSRFYSDMPRAEFDARINALDKKEQLSITEEMVANWSHRREALAVVLLPPLGVLVVGIGLFWAARGFRKPT